MIIVGYVIIDPKTHKIGETYGLYSGLRAKLYRTAGSASAAMKKSHLDESVYVVKPVAVVEISDDQG